MDALVGEFGSTGIVFNDDLGLLPAGSVSAVAGISDRQADEAIVFLRWLDPQGRKARLTEMFLSYTRLTSRLRGTCRGPSRS